MAKRLAIPLVALLAFPWLPVTASAQGPAPDTPAPAVFHIAPPQPACDWDTGAMRTFTNATELIQGAIDDAFRAGAAQSASRPASTRSAASACAAA